MKQIKEGSVVQTIGFDTEDEMLVQITELVFTFLYRAST